MASERPSNISSYYTPGYYAVPSIASGNLSSDSHALARWVAMAGDGEGVLAAPLRGANATKQSALLKAGLLRCARNDSDGVRSAEARTDPSVFVEQARTAD